MDGGRDRRFREHDGDGERDAVEQLRHPGRRPPLNLQGSTTQAGSLYLDDGPTLHNSGTYAITDDSNIVFGGVYGVVSNSGTLAKTGGTGTSEVDFLVNTGTVAVHSGTLLVGLLDGMTSTGTFAADSGTTLILGDGGVSIDDFNLLAANFGKTLAAGGDGPNPLAVSLWGFAVAHDDESGFIAATGVPEPGMAIVGMMAAAGMAGRRRSMCTTSE